jgi:hypothetical protein
MQLPILGRSFTATKKEKTDAITVKPVYNDHPWDPKKVAVVPRWKAVQ